MRRTVAAALAVAHISLAVSPPARAAEVATEYRAVRTNASSARLTIAVEISASTETTFAIVSTRRNAAGSLIASEPTYLGGSTPAGISADAGSTSVGCGDDCTIISGRTVTRLVLDLRDHGGSGAVDTVLLAFVGQRPRLTIVRAAGWRVSRVTAAFAVAGRGIGRAGAQAGPAGAAVLLQVDRDVPYGPAIAVARVPCAGARDVAQPATLTNGRRAIPIRCSSGGVAAVVGDGSPRWTVAGPAVGSSDAPANLVVFDL